ncbi:helix-turn-helix domain-containing protein [Paracoccus yeei]|uniref:helix-turn-helix domain-containing protein n=1 Tax=Paracoccus yeei TaxID=147645 RepID=UPI003C6E7472
MRSGAQASGRQSAFRLRTARRRQGPQRLQGRRPKIDPVEVRRLHEEERLSPTAIARRLGIARSSVYRFLPRVEQVDDL